MRFLRYLPLAALMFVGACDKEASITNVSRPPLAYIRYVHAVPDYGTTDFKFVDAVEYSPSYANSSFRTVGIYQGVRAGSRQWKVFRNSSNIAETQQVVAEGTTDFVAGQYYTVLHRGFAVPANGTPAQGVVLINDTRPDQSTTQVHVSIVNAAVGLANQDVFLCTPSAINILTGNNQTQTAGLLLADSIRVQAVDDCGFGVGAEPITFRITAGGGHIRVAGTTSGTVADSVKTITADTAGRAAVRWRLGAAGAQTMAVRTTQIAPVTVTATINVPPVMAGFTSASVAALPVPTLGQTAELAAGSPVLFGNIAPGTSRTAYAARPTGRFRIRTAATGTLTTLALIEPFAGVAGTVTADPVGGYRIAGTQFSMFIFPRSVAGSAAAPFTTPAVVSIVDRQPPRTVPE